MPGISLEFNEFKASKLKEVLTWLYIFKICFNDFYPRHVSFLYEQVFLNGTFRCCDFSIFPDFTSVSLLNHTHILTVNSKINSVSGQQKSIGRCEPKQELFGGVFLLVMRMPLRSGNMLVAHKRKSSFHFIPIRTNYIIITHHIHDRQLTHLKYYI